MKYNKYFGEGVQGDTEDRDDQKLQAVRFADYCACGDQDGSRVLFSVNQLSRVYDEIAHRPTENQSLPELLEEKVKLNTQGGYPEEVGQRGESELVEACNYEAETYEYHNMLVLKVRVERDG